MILVLKIQEAISKKLSEGFANEDVENERKRILALSPLDSAVVVKELIKVTAFTANINEKTSYKHVIGIQGSLYIGYFNPEYF